MKVIVIGGVAGGASAAARIRRLDSEAEIIIFEKGEHVSFSNCALPYYIGGVVESSDKLVMMTPKSFRARFDIDVRTNSEVVSINRSEKTVTVKDPAAEYTESYDKLIIATGASPVKPRSIEGVDNNNVYVIRNVNDAVKIKEELTQRNAKRVTVAGGGFIGLEAAENLVHAGFEVSLIEGMDQVMAPLDKDIVQLVHKELDDNGIRLHLGSMLKKITDTSVVYECGGKTSEIETDAVILSIGVRPENGLAVSADLKTGAKGGIVVNRNYQTSDPDIYAVGDVIEWFNSISRQKGSLALAGPAQRQARGAADHICGISSANKGFIGSSCLRIFGLNVASTGLNEKTLDSLGISYDEVFVMPPDKVGIMPGSSYMAFKLLFEVPSGRLLGAQAVGKGDVVRRVDVIASMITMGADLEDLKDLELCYSPVFGTAKDVVNIAALVALNVLTGRVKQVRVSEVRDLVLSGAYIVDVREEGEFMQGHIKGAHNVPLSQLRERLDEIPKDVPVYLHCRTAQRSYYAICELQNRGWTNVYNISASYLGISLNEYFEDKTSGRESILTEYNFN